MLQKGKFATWKVELGMYLLSLDENFLLSEEYGVRDEFNDKAKGIILNGILKFDILFVRHCDIAKQMLDML